MRKASKLRAKFSTDLPFGLEGICLSRPAAIAKIQQCIDVAGIDIQVLRLIELFHIEPEELAEAGLSYEHLKALERKILF